MKRSRMLVLPVILLAFALAGTACTRTTATGATEVACGAFEPLYWSSQDTPETIRQAKAHNAAGKALGCWN